MESSAETFKKGLDKAFSDDFSAVKLYIDTLH